MSSKELFSMTKTMLYTCSLKLPDLNLVMNGIGYNGLVKHPYNQHGLFVENQTATSALSASKWALIGIMEPIQQTPDRTPCVVFRPAASVKIAFYGMEGTGKVMHH